MQHQRQQVLNIQHSAPRSSERLKSLAQRESIDPPAWCKRIFYSCVHFFVRWVSVFFFNIRCHGRVHIDHPGAALVLSTHQSHLDPVLVGLVFNQRLNYLARRSLFKNPAFGLLIRLLDAIELDRDRSGLAGLKKQ